MDQIVKQAMQKWPNVPHCYGWLGLDARGQWYMRDEACQAAGGFASGGVQAKGARLQHAKLIAFIERNYACDARGCWYFQNGPQRVYVELEATPWVWRVSAQGEITTHTGLPAQYRQCLVDERGWVYLETDVGFGVVHTQDVAYAAELLEQQVWSAQMCERTALANRYGYQQQPVVEKAT